MGNIENQWREGVTRRTALAGLAGFLAGSPLLRAQQDPHPLSADRRALGIGEMRNVWDFEAVMYENVQRAIYAYTAHGDGMEWTLRRNRQAFEFVDLVPGKAVDPKSVNLSTQIYNTKMDFPLMIAPSATMVPLHPSGENGCFQGATAARIPMCVTVNSSQRPLEKIVGGVKGTFWWQLYGLEDVEANRPLLEEPQALGVQAIVITVDNGGTTYPRSQHTRNLQYNVKPITRAASPKPGATDLELYETLRQGGSRKVWTDWRWLDGVMKFIKVPVLIKGIQTAESAQACVDHGVGIVVSNHGGRQGAAGMSTLESLPEVVDVVKGRVPVMIDSGFRRGTDVLKALAMGANGIMLGRVPRWGLGAYGPTGVQRVLEILETELVQAVASAGRTSLASIDRTVVRTHFS